VVKACLPERFSRWAYRSGLLGAGPCDGVETVVKRVAAVAGDTVTTSAAGVVVNGQLLSGTRLDTRLDDGIRCGRRAPVPHVPFGERRLAPGELILLGDQRSESFDGRYTGPTRRIFGRAVLLIATGW
jgi:type IV secretory pathway protease TraF